MADTDTAMQRDEGRKGGSQRTSEQGEKSGERKGFTGGRRSREMEGKKRGRVKADEGVTKGDEELRNRMREVKRGEARRVD